MEEQVQKSCWGVTTVTLLVVALGLTAVYLFGGFDLAQSVAR